MKVNERFSNYVKEKWRNAPTLAKALGVSRSYVYQLMNGDAAIGVKPLNKIKEIDPEFDLAYILTGNSEAEFVRESDESYSTKEPKFSLVKKEQEELLVEEESTKHVPVDVVKLMIEDHRNEIKRLESIIDKQYCLNEQQEEIIKLLINDIKKGH